MTVCHLQPGFCITEIYTLESLSGTECKIPSLMSFTPNRFVDITDYINIKKQVLEAYSEEMQETSHSRSIET
jgi:hypothetical protein